jgi:hypothetical protein
VNKQRNNRIKGHGEKSQAEGRIGEQMRFLPDSFLGKEGKRICMM